MKSQNTFGIIFAAFFLTPLSHAETKAPDADIPNVIIITLSGIRNSESINDLSRQFTPHLFNDLAKDGTLYTRMTDYNCEFHMPSVDSINTGRDYSGFWGSIKSPSLFQYIRKKYSLPADKLWSIGHWTYNGCVFKTPGFTEETYPCQIAMLDTRNTPNNISYSLELEEILTDQELLFVRDFNKQMKIEQYVHFWDSAEEITNGIFKKIMRRFKPIFIHYVMSDAETGHYDTFGRYVLSIKKCDQNIYEIWKMIQADPFYKNRTFLIVTPDHYRDSYYMQHCENTPDNPSLVWMYIYGPGIKKGAVINRQVDHKDIFSTVAFIMKLEVTNPEGKLLEDCFLQTKNE